MLAPADYQLFKENMKQRYDSLPKKLRCKCLHRDIVINARGFHHLLYDGSGKARTMREAYSRLQLIPLIAPVLRLADDSTYEKTFGRKSRKKDSPSVKIERWGMEAIVGKSKIKVRVVVRRENDGQFFFWSVMKVG